MIDLLNLFLPQLRLIAQQFVYRHAVIGRKHRQQQNVRKALLRLPLGNRRFGNANEASHLFLGDFFLPAQADQVLRQIQCIHISHLLSCYQYTE